MQEFMTRNMPRMKLFVRFVISGGTAALVNIILLYIFTDKLGMWYLLSSSIAFVFAFSISFVLQKWWTFRDDSTHVLGKQIGQYFIAGLGNLAANTALMFLLTDIVGLWYMFSQVITGGTIAIASFLIYKFYIFKHYGHGQTVPLKSDNG